MGATPRTPDQARYSPAWKISGSPPGASSASASAIAITWSPPGSSSRTGPATHAPAPSSTGTPACSRHSTSRNFSSCASLPEKRTAVASWSAARTFTASRPCSRTAASVREPRSRHTNTSIGSSDREVKALVVRPAGPRVVTTVTPVANWPIAALNAAGSTPAPVYQAPVPGRPTPLAYSRRELSIPAELSRLPQIRGFAEDAAIAFGLDPSTAFEVKSAASEAAANAIEHGSSGPADEVVLEAVEEAGAFVLYVRDTGSFRPRVNRRGDLPERGRGLQFLGQMMDEVDVRPGVRGTEVRMVKRPAG